jgi:4a-hydroxytetrahydrobiopterin dehydratase
MKTYISSEIREKLESIGLSEWKAGSDHINRDLTFKDFKAAMQFMVKAGDIADAMDHHPDWSNVYNKVHIKLFTHDAGGVTDKDFELAQKMEDIQK